MGEKYSWFCTKNNCPFCYKQYRTKKFRPKDGTYLKIVVTPILWLDRTVINSKSRQGSQQRNMEHNVQPIARWYMYQNQCH